MGEWMGGWMGGLVGGWVGWWVCRWVDGCSVQGHLNQDSITPVVKQWRTSAAADCCKSDAKYNTHLEASIGGALSRRRESGPSAPCAI